MMYKHKLYISRKKIQHMEKKIDWLTILIICLLGITSISGIVSIDFNSSYNIINQYDDIVRIYGNGIYANDSYFKAPILIGTDFCILFVVIPLLINNHKKRAKTDSDINRLKLMSVYVVVLYYATSCSFGVTYNSIHLVYIALFASSLFGMFSLLRKIKVTNFNYTVTNGLHRFLIISGISLIVAWMPDIIPTIFNGKSLTLIEIYTTEITYVLDMGIIAPLCLICLHLLNKQDSLGIVILALLLKLCIVVGLMMIPQTVFQIISGANLPLPVIITKSVSFLILGGFAYYFNKKLYATL